MMISYFSPNEPLCATRIDERVNASPFQVNGWNVLELYMVPIHLRCVCTFNIHWHSCERSQNIVVRVPRDLFPSFRGMTDNFLEYLKLGQAWGSSWSWLGIESKLWATTAGFTPTKETSKWAQSHGHSADHSLPMTKVQSRRKKSQLETSERQLTTFLDRVSCSRSYEETRKLRGSPLYEPKNSR